MKRELAEFIKKDLIKKIILLSGPRQAGKTTLSKTMSLDFDYLNYDEDSHRTILRKKSWDRKKDLLILDEIHKMPQWKRYLKGIYDTEGNRPKILVTGSARLDTMKRAGESLAGRHFTYRLHPLDLAEVASQISPDDALTRILTVGGFPEPFLDSSESFYYKWRKSHLDVILRQDALDLEAIRDVKSLELLVELLQSRVGSPLSIASVARDLYKDPKTVLRWIELLERLYVVFRVFPYHKNVARSVTKEAKLYFFDVARVEDSGAKLENCVAASLLKHCHYLEDALGIPAQLYYLRTKDGKEVDFFLQVKGKKPLLLEVKSSDATPSTSLNHFKAFFPQASLVQLSKNLERESTWPNGVEVRKLAPWLAKLRSF